MDRYAIGLLCLVFLAVSCSNSQTAKTPRGMDFQGKNYALENVHDWEEKRNHMGADRIWLSPPRGPNDTFRENVTVTVEDIQEGMRLEDYIGESSADLATLGITATANYEPTTINGFKASVAHINYTMGAVELTVDSYVILDGNHAYVISCTATQEAYEEYREKFEEMVKTFSISA